MTNDIKINDDYDVTLSYDGITKDRKGTLSRCRYHPQMVAHTGKHYRAPLRRRPSLMTLSLALILAYCKGPARRL
jgi:hypothetical protein